MSVNISVSHVSELEQIASVEYSLVDHRDSLKFVLCNVGRQRLCDFCDLLIVKSFGGFCEAT